jgi:hypothetical protein
MTLSKSDVEGREGFRGYAITEAASVARLISKSTESVKISSLDSEVESRMQPDQGLSTAHSGRSLLGSGDLKTPGGAG